MMKKIGMLLVSAAVCAAVGAQAEGLKWKRDLMDGSRTGCTVPMLTNADEALGTVRGCTYYAPNGRKYKNGSVVRVARGIIGLQPAMAQVKAPVGMAAKEMVKAYPESPLSNFFIDALMEETEKLTGRKVDIGVGNFGGIRVDMPAGQVIVDDIMSMFPFRNDVVFMTIKGSQVRGMLERMAEHGFGVLGGMKVVAEESKLVSVEVGGEPLDDEKVYSLATISFLLDGGDGVALRKLAIELEVFPVSIYDAIVGHIRAEDAAGRMIDAEADGRVQIRTSGNSGKSDRAIDYGELSDGEGVSSGRRLTLLHTNDTHSHIEPVRGGGRNALGGVIERAAYVDSVRRAVGRRNMLLLDAGDFSQGTSYFTIFKGDVEVDVMNAMRYDVACLGNHEFDNGMDELARRLKKARYDIVCANYDFSGSPLENIVKPYTIVRRGGNKIGIIGLLTDVTRVVDRSIADRMEFLDPVEAANRYAGYLKEEKGCDMVICLSHLGFDGRCSDVSLAGLTEDVDMIVGGHSHTELERMAVRQNADGEDVVILQDGSWGVYVGNLTMD